MSHCRQRAPRPITACLDWTRSAARSDRVLLWQESKRGIPPSRAAPGHEPLQEARAALHDGVLGLERVPLWQERGERRGERGRPPREPHLAMSHCRKRAPRSMTACSDWNAFRCEGRGERGEGRGERGEGRGGRPPTAPHLAMSHLQEARAALHNGVLGLERVPLWQERGEGRGERGIPPLASRTWP